MIIYLFGVTDGFPLFSTFANLIVHYLLPRVRIDSVQLSNWPITPIVIFKSDETNEMRQNKDQIKLALVYRPKFRSSVYYRKQPANITDTMTVLMIYE